MPTPATSVDVTLRPVEPADLDRLFEIQADPEACRMAAVLPRTRAAFDGAWAKIFADRSTTGLAIIADGALAGSIGCFKQEGAGGAMVDSVGYWIAREHWGRGIATRALTLLVADVKVRPLFARAARSNGASVRVLERCGFRLLHHQHSPATERYLACEEAVLRLD
jgi:RimJ/RimL family protein N-acetyltransferase